MSVDPKSSVPIYQQIADEIGRAIAAGLYRPGEAIPSLRALALKLVVNPNTVQRAYEELERRGLIEARKGLGMFVSLRAAEFAKDQSTDEVRAAFDQGISAGRSAKMPMSQIRAVFDDACRDSAPNDKEQRT